MKNIEIRFFYLSIVGVTLMSLVFGALCNSNKNQAMQNTIAIQLIAEPLVLSMDDLEDFRIGFEATNASDKTVDPRLYDTVLFVDGKRNYAWDLAVQNSPREEAWWNLKPGKTVKAFWPLGEALFDNPGEYEIVLRLDTQESKIQVKVNP